MSCEICGRGACAKSFHSLEEQCAFDAIADGIKDRTSEIIYNRLNSLPGEHSPRDIYLISLEDALAACDL